MDSHSPLPCLCSIWLADSVTSTSHQTSVGITHWLLREVQPVRRKPDFPRKDTTPPPGEQQKHLQDCARNKCFLGPVVLVPRSWSIASSPDGSGRCHRMPVLGMWWSPGYPGSNRGRICYSWNLGWSESAAPGKSVRMLCSHRCWETQASFQQDPQAAQPQHQPCLHEGTKLLASKHSKLPAPRAACRLLCSHCTVDAPSPVHRVQADEPCTASVGGDFGLKDTWPQVNGTETTSSFHKGHWTAISW